MGFCKSIMKAGNCVRKGDFKNASNRLKNKKGKYFENSANFW